MPTRNLLRTSSFRIAVLYVALFCASVAALLAFIYRSTVAVIEEQTISTIEAEIRGLAEQYNDEGLERLIEVVRERSGPGGDADSVYLLTDPRRQRLAGNLDEWPARADRPSGQWVTLELSKREGEADVPHGVQARTFILPGQFRLLVGRDTHQRSQFRQTVIEALGWGLAATLGLGLAGGLFVSRSVLRRVDAVTATSRRIMRDDLSGRVPTAGSGDEFDRLAGNLNDMLDQIERLMTGMRAVTDALAHDLRGPLTRLRARLETAKNESAPATPERQLSEDALAELDTILATFDTLVRIARAEAGALRTDIAVIDLSTLANEIADLYRPLTEDNGQILGTDIAPKLHVRAHRQLLAQALSNLLENAIKYAPRDTRIDLVAERAGASVRLKVCDSGPGIAAADRARVLDRFTRLDSSRSTRGSGLGLGLVAAVAKLHDAILELGDNAPGLTVTLTFAAAVPEQVIDTEQEPGGAPTLPSPSVAHRNA